MSDSQQEHNNLDQRFSALCLKIESLWSEVGKRLEDLQRSNEIWELKREVPASLDPEQQDKVRRWGEEQGQILNRIDKTMASVKGLETQAARCFEDLAFHCADFSHQQSDQANHILQQFRKEVQSSLPKIEVGDYFFTPPETVRLFLAQLRSLALRGRELVQATSSALAERAVTAVKAGDATDSQGPYSAADIESTGVESPRSATPIAKHEESNPSEQTLEQQTLEQQALAKKRIAMLETFRQRTGLTAASVYETKGVADKADFYRWRRGELPPESEMTRKIEDHLKRATASQSPKR